MRVVLIAIYVLSVFLLVSLKKIVFFLAVSVVKLCSYRPLSLRKLPDIFIVKIFEVRNILITIAPFINRRPLIYAVFTKPNFPIRRIFK